MLLRVAALSRALGAFGALAACSPYGGGAFECSTSDQCGATGTCSSGFCSFPDSTCPSGQRYGELSGPSSGQCVGAVIDASMPDMPRPDMFVTPDGQTCYGTGLVRACFTQAPSGARVLNATINTDNSPLCDDSGLNDNWCVIAGQTVSVQGTVTAVGMRPLVLVATTTIDVPGTLDVASHRNPASVGAGANAAGCNAGTAPGTSGGGAGGSFGGSGGNGGNGLNVANSGGVAGNGLTLTAARGGCRGQNGNGGAAGQGGAGGGAVFLIAETSINVIGTINASGAGATPGTTASSGGGGGGSGGLIGLDAPACMASGLIMANGGGGGEGAGQMTTGLPGNDPVGGAGGTAQIAPGNSGNGGDGGAGASTAAPGPGLTGTATGGGGGGGGGAGIIMLERAASITGGAIVSPAPI